MYYLINLLTGEIIEFYDDIDDAISRYVIKRNELYEQRLYNKLYNFTLIYCEKGDLNVLY